MEPDLSKAREELTGHFKRGALGTWTPTADEVAKAIAGAMHADFTDEDVRTATADVIALYRGGKEAEVVRALWEAGSDSGSFDQEAHR